jgi:hypothetical protein
MLLLHENDLGKWRAIRLTQKIAIILVSRLSVSVSGATQCDYKTQVSDRPMECGHARRVLCCYRRDYKSNFYILAISKTTLLGPRSRKVRKSFVTPPMALRRIRILSFAGASEGNEWGWMEVN